MINNELKINKAGLLEVPAGKRQLTLERLVNFFVGRYYKVLSTKNVMITANILTERELESIIPILEAEEVELNIISH